MLSNQGNRITIMFVLAFFFVAYYILIQELSLIQVIGLYMAYCIIGYGTFGILDGIFESIHNEN